MTWRDRSVRTADDLAVVSNNPVLAVIPPLNTGRRRRRLAQAVGGTADVAGR
jgi:hypothetical protein